MPMEPMAPGPWKSVHGIGRNAGCGRSGTQMHASAPAGFLLAILVRWWRALNPPPGSGADEAWPLTTGRRDGLILICICNEVQYDVSAAKLPSHLLLLVTADCPGCTEAGYPAGDAVSAAPMPIAVFARSFLSTLFYCAAATRCMLNFCRFFYGIITRSL